MIDSLFQALNGFLLILTCDGEVFFATHSIESYLGFHQVCWNFSINQISRRYGSKEVNKDIMDFKFVFK